MKPVLAFLVALVLALSTESARAAITIPNLADEWSKPTNYTEARVMTLSPGNGIAVDWGDHVVVRTQANEWEPKAEHELRLGQSTDYSGQSFMSGVVGMKVGEKRRLQVAPYRVAVRDSDYEKIDVELLSVMPRPKAPIPPAAWSQRVETPNLRFELTSTLAIKDLRVNFRDKPAPILEDGGSFAGLEESERAPVVFVDCLSHDAPTAAALKPRADGTISVTFCTWEPGFRTGDNWNPTIGSAKVLVTVRDTLGETDPKRDRNARIELGMYSDVPEDGRFNAPRFSVAKTKPPLRHGFKKEYLTKNRDVELWISPFFYVVQPDHDGTYSQMTLKRSTVSLGYTIGPVSDPALSTVSETGTRSIGLFSDLTLILGAIIIAAGLRFLLRDVREKALLSGTASPGEHLQGGSAAAALIAWGIATAILHGQWRSSYGYAVSVLYPVDIDGNGRASGLLILLIVLFTTIWAIFGARQAPVGRPLLRLLMIAPLGLESALGADAIVASAALMAWGVSDAIVRYRTLGRLWGVNADFVPTAGSVRQFAVGPQQEAKLRAEVAALVADIRGMGDEASWQRFGDRASYLRPAVIAADAMGGGSNQAVLALAISMTSETVDHRSLLAQHMDLEAWAIPYAATVMARANDVSPAAAQLYERALQVPVDSRALEQALRAGLEKTFPAMTAGTAVPNVVRLARETRADWPWAGAAATQVALVRGNADAGDLAAIAVSRPEAIAGREETAVASIVAAGNGVTFAAAVVARMNAANALAYLPLLHELVSCGVPFPRFQATALPPLDGTMESKQRVFLAHVLFASGDVVTALRVCRDALKGYSPAQAPIDASTRPLIAWIVASAAVALGDGTVLMQLLAANGTAEYGLEAITELRIALGDRDALRTVIADFGGGSMPKWKRVLLARAQLALGTYDDALDTLEALPEASPTVTLLFARAQILDKQATAAVATLVPLAQQLPFWSELLYRLGTARMATGDIPNASQKLQQATRAGSSRSVTALAELARRAGDASGTQQALQHIANGGAPSVDAMVDAFAVAIAARQLAVADAIHRWLGDRLMGWPRLATLTGNLCEARRDFAGAKVAYAASNEYARLGVIAMRENDLAAATEALDHIPDRELDQIRSAAVLDAVAVAAVGRSDLARAGRALSALLTLRPGDATAQRDFADVSLSRAGEILEGGTPGAFGEARDLLVEAARKTPDPRVTRGIVDVMMLEIRQAVLAGSASDRERVRPLIDDARARSGRDPRCAFFEAALELTIGQTARVEQLVAALDGNVWAAYFRGLARWKGGDASGGEAFLRRAMAADDSKLATAAWMAIMALGPIDSIMDEDLQLLAGGT